MASLESVFSDNASSVLPQPLIREWTDKLRNLDQKHRDEIENLKAKANQLEAKVKALTEENEKLKTELATGSAVAVVNNMELLLKGLETRMNEKAQNTALQQSNIILESINKKHEDNEKKMQQHTKTVQDSIVASAEVIEAQGKYVLDSLGAFECMQYLSDYRIGPRAYDERLEKGKLCFSMLEVFIKNTRAGDNAKYPFIYIRHDKVEDYSNFKDEMESWGIDLRASHLVYIEGREYAKQTPFKPDEWPIHLANDVRCIEISWINSKQAYEVACHRLTAT